jgi:DNA-binding NarL/FixJ family response regulator
LAALSTVLTSFRTAAPPRLHLVEITGEPGIGKTRFLARLRQESRPHRVLSGRASELTGIVPFSVLVDAIDDELAALSAHRGRIVGDESAGLLAEVFPALAEAGSYGDAGPSPERYETHRAIQELISRLAVPRGLVLTLDDMHWADAASMEFIAHLLRRPPLAPILIALAYRPRQLPGPLAAALRAGPPPDLRLDLGPLSRAEATELLGATVPASRQREVYRRSGGNPLYLDALARVVAGGSRRPDGQSAQYPPNWPVLAVLRAEFEQLPPRQRLIAQAASVLDDPFDPEQVAEVADLTLADTHAGLAGLIQRDLIRLERHGDAMHYRHPLVRDVVYRTAGRGWQQIAHTRAAEALARASAPLTHRAPHVMRVARVGDQAAVHLLTNAATVTMMTSPSTAAQWLQAALHNLPEDQIERRIELLDDLAKALQLAGRLSDSRTTYEQLLALLPFGTQERVDAAVACSRVEVLLGRSGVARELIVDELRRLPGDTSDHLIALHVELASARVLSGEFIGVDQDQMIEVLEIARQRGDRGLEATALSELAAALMGVGDIPAALDWRRQAAEQMDSLTDNELVAQLEALTALGWTEFFLGLNEAALRHLERGLRLCQRSGKHDLLTYLLAGTEMALWDLGRIADAMRYAEDAVDAAELSGSEHLRVVAYSMQSLVHVTRRDGPAAMKTAETAVEASGLRRNWFYAVAGGALGFAKLIMGDAPGCLDTAVPAFGGPDMPLIDPLHRPFFAQGLVLAELARGRPDDARGWLRIIEKAVENGVELPKYRGYQEISRARIAIFGGDPAACAEHAKAAAAAFATASHRANEADSWLLAGIAMAALGGESRDGAIAALERAGELFDAGGLVARRAEVDAQLDQLRTTPPPAAQPALAKLTARETEVAQLIAAGLSNPEIAERLGLRPRTVETHVTNIRGKLGVRSRTALATAVIDATSGR